MGYVICYVKAPVSPKFLIPDMFLSMPIKLFHSLNFEDYFAIHLKYPLPTNRNKYSY